MRLCRVGMCTGADQVASGRPVRSRPAADGTDQIPPAVFSRHFISDLGDSHCLLELCTMSKVRCGSPRWRANDRCLREADGRFRRKPDITGRDIDVAVRQTANRLCINFLHRMARDSIAVGATCKNPCHALCGSASAVCPTGTALRNNTYGAVPVNP
jgi:hypothetical protein